MVRCSNSLVGIINFVVFLLSVPILVAGIWLRLEASSACDRFLDKPVIALGVFLTVVSIAGLVGSCCRVSWLLWFYLIVMLVLILLLFCFTLFSLVVSSKGAGEPLSNRGYKDYRLGDYSRWLQNRVKSAKNWNRIRSCLSDNLVCRRFEYDMIGLSVDEFYQQKLSSLQSGCCKPPDECKFTYVSATNWTKTEGRHKNHDCDMWDNNAEKLCYECGSCKAGLLDNIKSSWKKVAIVNVVFLVFLVVVYTMGCFALRNNKRDEIYAYDYAFKP